MANPPLQTPERLCEKTLRFVVDLLEQQANEGYVGEDVDGDFLAAQRIRRELLGLEPLQFPDHSPLSGRG